MLSVALLALVGCGAGSTGAADAPYVAPVNAFAAVTRSPDLRVVDLGQAPVRQVTGSADALWAWTESENAAAVTDVSGLHTAPATVSLMRNGQFLIPGTGTNIIAPAPDGTLWLASGHELAHVHPDTGAVQTWQVPTLASSAVAASFNVGVTGGWVQDLAVDPGSGQVYLALALAGSLSRFTPASETFTTIRLPPLGDVNSLAVLEDGSLGVGLNAYPPTVAGTVAIISPQGHTRLVPGAVNALRAADGRFVYDDGAALGTVTTTGLKDLTAGGAGPTVTLAAHSLADDRFVTAVPGALQVRDGAAHVVQTYPLGTSLCGGTGGLDAAGGIQPGPGAGRHETFPPVPCTVNARYLGAYGHDGLFAYTEGAGLLITRP